MINDGKRRVEERGRKELRVQEAADQIPLVNSMALAACISRLKSPTSTQRDGMGHFSTTWTWAQRHVGKRGAVCTTSSIMSAAGQIKIKSSSSAVVQYGLTHILTHRT